MAYSFCDEYFFITISGFVTIRLGKRKTIFISLEWRSLNNIYAVEDEKLHLNHICYFEAGSKEGKSNWINANLFATFNPLSCHFRIIGIQFSGFIQNSNVQMKSNKYLKLIKSYTEWWMVLHVFGWIEQMRKNMRCCYDINSSQFFFFHSVMIDEWQNKKSA